MRTSDEKKIEDLRSALAKAVAWAEDRYGKKGEARMKDALKAMNPAPRSATEAMLLVPLPMPDWAVEGRKVLGRGKG
ncbi:MAG: hypothetical protein V3W44_05085 [Dehalococcoidales bacterium]